MIYGATPQTWAHWDLVLELGEDLLPVVCQPGLPIAPSSALTSYGKVPSRFDGHGRVVGFPKWTQYAATPADLEAWSQDDRLGICVQTRRVRALDVDIEDWDESETVASVIDDWCLDQGLLLPVRTRANTGKFLLLFDMEGTYAKQVLNTETGIIEFLANGQQCLVAGSHPSGVRYTWTGGVPASFPILTTTQFRVLQRHLRDTVGTADWTEGRLRRARTEGSSVVVDDPVATYLHEKGWVRR
jgi:hypothetical protein